MPNSPTGTDTKKMSRQLIGASTPPRTSPMKVPLKAAAWFTPRAIPRWLSGNTSVRIAAELAMSMAAPTPWKMGVSMVQAESDSIPERPGRAQLAIDRVCEPS